MKKIKIGISLKPNCEIDRWRIKETFLFLKTEVLSESLLSLTSSCSSILLQLQSILPNLKFTKFNPFRLNFTQNSSFYKITSFQGKILRRTKEIVISAWFKIWILWEKRRVRRLWNEMFITDAWPSKNRELVLEVDNRSTNGCK